MLHNNMNMYNKCIHCYDFSYVYYTFILKFLIEFAFEQNHNCAKNSVRAIDSVMRDFF